MMIINKFQYMEKFVLSGDCIFIYWYISEEYYKYKTSDFSIFTNIYQIHMDTQIYKKLKSIDIQNNITYFDYINICIYNYFYALNPSEKYLVDKCFEKIKFNHIIKTNIKNLILIKSVNKFNYKQLSMSSIIMKNKLLDDEYNKYKNKENNIKFLSICIQFISLYKKYLENTLNTFSMYITFYT